MPEATWLVSGFEPRPAGRRPPLLAATLLCSQCHGNLGTTLGTWQVCHLLEIDLIPKRLQVARGSGAGPEEGPFRSEGTVASGVGRASPGAPTLWPLREAPPRCLPPGARVPGRRCRPPGSQDTGFWSPAVVPEPRSKARAQPCDVSVPGDPATPSLPFLCLAPPLTPVVSCCLSPRTS